MKISVTHGKTLGPMFIPDYRVCITLTQTTKFYSTNTVKKNTRNLKNQRRRIECRASKMWKLSFSLIGPLVLFFFYSKFNLLSFKIIQFWFSNYYTVCFLIINCLRPWDETEIILAKIEPIIHNCFGKLSFDNDQSIKNSTTVQS